jgi:hypothetical protein
MTAVGRYYADVYYTYNVSGVPYVGNLIIPPALFSLGLFLILLMRRRGDGSSGGKCQIGKSFAIKQIDPLLDPFLDSPHPLEVSRSKAV